MKARKLRIHLVLTTDAPLAALKKAKSLRLNAEDKKGNTWSIQPDEVSECYVDDDDRMVWG